MIVALPGEAAPSNPIIHSHVIPVNRYLYYNTSLYQYKIHAHPPAACPVAVPRTATSVSCSSRSPYCPHPPRSSFRPVPHHHVITINNLDSKFFRAGFTRRHRARLVCFIMCMFCNVSLHSQKLIGWCKQCDTACLFVVCVTTPTLFILCTASVLFRHVTDVHVVAN